MSFILPGMMGAACRVTEPIIVSNSYAIDVNGTNQYGTVADHNDFSFGDASTDSPFSAALWVNVDNWTKFRMLYKGDGTNMEYLITGDGTGLLSFILADNDLSNFLQERYSTGLSTATDYFLAFTYSGSGTNAGMKIYVDGSAVATTTDNTGTYTAMHNTTGPLYTGRSVLAPAYANGRMDEIGIWSSELSAAEITKLYASGGGDVDYSQNAGDYVSAANLKGWWRFEEGTGSSIADSSGNSHTLSLFNTPTFPAGLPA